MLEAVDRIGSSDSQGLQAYCEQSYCQAERGGEKEYPYLYVGPVGELLEPCLHGEIGDGPGDEQNERALKIQIYFISPLFPRSWPRLEKRWMSVRGWRASSSVSSLEYFLR